MVIFKFIFNRFAWIFNCLRDENDRLSLSRSTYLAAFVIACLSWNAGLEITVFHFSFLLIQLAYILFKDRALALLDKLLNTVIAVKTGVVKKEDEI